MMENNALLQLRENVEFLLYETQLLPYSITFTKEQIEFESHIISTIITSYYSYDFF